MCITIKGMCVLAALTSVDVYEREMPTEAYSYDGKARDISKFYESESDEFSVGLVAFIDDTRINVNYDNGFTSNKLRIDDTTTVHVTQAIELDDQWSLALTAGASFGGKTRHTACTDGFGREYYCGDLTAWSDFSEPEHEQYMMGRVQVKYKF